MEQERGRLVRMQSELHLEKTRNEALNVEIARLKRWRFGSSSESLESSTQVVLFDAILADTQIEDLAAQEALKATPSPRRAKRQAAENSRAANLKRDIRTPDG